MALSAGAGRNRRRPDLHDMLTMLEMQSYDRRKRCAQATRLSIEDAIDRRLGSLDFCSETSLAPTGLLLDFPEKGRRVFVHGSQSIRE